MSYQAALQDLQSLGDKFRSEPLSTFDDQSLIRELAKRGYSIFDLRVETLSFDFGEVLDLGQL